MRLRQAVTIVEGENETVHLALMRRTSKNGERSEFRCFDGTHLSIVYMSIPGDRSVTQRVSVLRGYQPTLANKASVYGHFGRVLGYLFDGGYPCNTRVPV